MPSARGGASVRRRQARDEPRFPARRTSIMASVHAVALQMAHRDIDVLLAGEDLRGDAVRTEGVAGLLSEKIQDRVLCAGGPRYLLADDRIGGAAVETIRRLPFEAG